MEWHNSPMFALENGHWNNGKGKFGIKYSRMDQVKFVEDSL